jgi:hypothetical protein
MSLLEEMAIHFRIGRPDLLRIVRTAPARYKQYTIPKRTGGVRTIAQPSRELKALQRYIMATKLSKFSIHQAATGYIKHRNIHYNAECHKHARVILKLDFENFFPSIIVHDWDVLLSKHTPPEIDRRAWRTNQNSFHAYVSSMGASWWIESCGLAHQDDTFVVGGGCG